MCAADAASATRSLRARADEHGSTRGWVAYRDREFGKPGVKILPGGFYATQQDCVLATVVGSCISVCLWDSAAGAGGMNHFMLPQAELARAPGLVEGAYGMAAMELLINALLKLGAERRRLQAKVFGGAQMMQGPGVHNVGERNVQFVDAYLCTEGIAVLARDVLGLQPRRLAFFPRDGRVLLKRLGYLPQDARAQQAQSDSALALARRNAGGSVELFDPSR